MESTFLTTENKQKKVNLNNFRELKSLICHNHYESPLEVVYLNDGRVMCIDEEGKLKDLPYNQKATEIAKEFEAIYPSDYIVGDAVILDSVDDLDALY